MHSRMWHCVRLAYKLLRVSSQIVFGCYRLLGVPRPLVSIFGASRARPDEKYSEIAHKLAGMFSEAGISVITGGGPGIMQAASCGVTEGHPYKSKSCSIGIGVRGLKEPHNACMNEYMLLDYFFARKWLLTHYSTAYIIFPGGYGTIDELSELLTLMSTDTMLPAPMVFIGVEFWAPLFNWFKSELLKHKYIDEQSLKLFVLTDDLNEAFDIVVNVCEQCQDQSAIDKELV